MPLFRAYLLGAVAAALTFGLACSAQTAPDASIGQQPTFAVPKILTIGVLREPATLIPEATGLVESTGGADQIIRIPRDSLMVSNAAGTWRPRLAAEGISTENGTWRVNPDGTMDTIWKVRPNIKWHDGTPFTSADLVFTFQVYTNPELPPGGLRAGLNLMSSAAAPDPQTFILGWSAAFVNADRADGFVPLPRHLLEDVFQRDKTAFLNSPRFTTEFVGLGAYRLAAWEPGSHIEFTRFDDYYLGRPPFDTVVARFFGDPTVMLAAIFAGAVDVVLPKGIDTDGALEAKRRWEGTGNQVFLPLTDNLRHLELQFRAEFARPMVGLTNLLVREALYRSIDRQLFTEGSTQGLSPVADSWFSPVDPLRSRVEASIPQFPYDPARAQQLLAQAGWGKGSDGKLVQQANGERFEITLATTQSARSEKELNVLADGWKAAGTEVELVYIPPALGGDREYRSKLPGANINGIGAGSFSTDRLHSRETTTPANRWNGGNRGGYNNPKVDAILDKLVVTIQPAERLALQRQLLQEQMGDVALMPLLWDVAPVLAVAGVTGITDAESTTGSIHAWSKE